MWGGYGNCTTERVKYYDSLKNLVPGKDDYLIVDEADVFVYQNPIKLFETVKLAKQTICFTATMGKSLDFLEAKVFKPAKMVVYNYMRDYTPLVVDGLLKGKSDTEICQSLQTERKKKPVLVYCTESLFKAM